MAYHLKGVLSSIGGLDHNGLAVFTYVRDRAVDSVEADQAPILLAKPSSREALMLALFAVAAQNAPHSGTYSAVQPLQAEVTKYRG